MLKIHMSAMSNNKWLTKIICNNTWPRNSCHNITQSISNGNTASSGENVDEIYAVKPIN